MFNSRRCKEIRKNHDWSERCTDREPRTDEEEDENTKISNKETTFLWSAKRSFYALGRAGWGMPRCLSFLVVVVDSDVWPPPASLSSCLFVLLLRSFIFWRLFGGFRNPLARLCVRTGRWCADLLHFELLMMKIKPRLDINCSAGAICCTRRRALSKNRKLISCNFAIFFSVPVDGQIIVDKREFP